MTMVTPVSPYNREADPNHPVADSIDLARQAISSAASEELMVVNQPVYKVRFHLAMASLTGWNTALSPAGQLFPVDYAERPAGEVTDRPFRVSRVDQA
ncbi:hypothetical protein, partial [Actinokineospora sp.]|uniref:hypothetical protein n=1 Tax=Actinokineospora sp. TaxID=1872133 RepID=UPI003D6AF98F